MKSAIPLKNRAPSVNSFGSFKPNLPVGSSVVDDTQFSALEKIFNRFYKWYCPKQVIDKKIAAPNFRQNMSQDYEHKFMS
jgi:hypothetical protein